MLAPWVLPLLCVCALLLPPLASPLPTPTTTAPQEQQPDDQPDTPDQPDQPDTNPDDPEERPKLLLVSFDGFRWDYIDRVPTPNFHALMKEGVQVEQVKNIYITKTFPNHYTLVTGLYAESHGIVSNEMFDPALNATFSVDSDSVYDSRWWEQGVPLWETVQSQGGRSGAAMWPGADVKIHGTFPERYLPYNGSVPFETRVQHVVEWFSAEEPVDFAVLYWEEPDHSGHLLGPESPLMDEVIADVDEKIGFLRQELRKAGLYDRVNLIVTSDHGMMQLSTEKIIELDEYVSRDLYAWVDKSPVVAIIPNEGKLDDVYNKLKDANPYMAVYKKEDIPAQYHYQHNLRIMPLLLEAQEGWTIVQNRTAPFMLGNHGYNNSLRSMHPVFVARGPAFRQDFVQSSMRSVDLYPLMCHILSVRPSPNNGSLERVKDLLSRAPPLPPPPPPPPPPSPSPRVPQYSYAPVVGSMLSIVMVTGFLIFYIKEVTVKQLPALPRGSTEMSQPLLQDDFNLHFLETHRGFINVRHI